MYEIAGDPILLCVFVVGVFIYFSPVFIRIFFHKFHIFFNVRIQVCTFLFYICAKLLNYVQVWLCEKPGFEHYFLKHVCDHICTVFFSAHFSIQKTLEFLMLCCAMCWMFALIYIKYWEACDDSVLPACFEIGSKYKKLSILSLIWLIMLQTLIFFSVCTSYKIDYVNCSKSNL